MGVVGPAAPQASLCLAHLPDRPVTKVMMEMKRTTQPGSRVVPLVLVPTPAQ